MTLTIYLEGQSYSIFEKTNHNYNNNADKIFFPNVHRSGCGKYLGGSTSSKLLIYVAYTL